MNRAHWAATTAFAGIALLGASLAGATTVQKMTVRDLAKKSESIVLARVEDETARMDEGSKEIYTYVTLRVIEGVKGSKRNDNAKSKNADELITIRQLGGTYGKYISVVPGMPTFQKGEEVVVFLSQKDRAGYPWVMGLQQGKYSVSTDDNGFKQVRNDMDGLTVVEENGLKMEAKGSTVQPLASFLDGIKTQLDLDGAIRANEATPTE